MTINKVGLKFGNMALRKVTELLVLHHQGATARQTVKQIHDYHKNSKGWAGIGYHFYVRTTGEIFEGRPIEYVGAHAYGHNNNSIGICFEGNFEIEKMSEAQKEAGKWLVSYILNKYPTIKTIKGHRDLMATACPGKNFPFAEIAKGITSPPVVENTTATTTDTVYVVKKYDTLSKIAERYNTTYQKLAEYNGIKNPNVIYEGQKIKIPSNSSAAKEVNLFEKGRKIILNDANLYPNASSKNATKTISGTYYIYDGINVDGKYRITNSASRVGKKPIGENVTGFIKKADIK